mgnify:CR=1 FL=1
MDRTSGTVTLLLLRAIPHVIIFLTFLVLWEISIILGWIDNKPTCYLFKKTAKGYTCDIIVFNS